MEKSLVVWLGRGVCMMLGLSITTDALKRESIARIVACGAKSVICLVGLGGVS